MTYDAQIKKFETKYDSNAEAILEDYGFKSFTDLVEIAATNVDENGECSDEHHLDSIDGILSQY